MPIVKKDFQKVNRLVSELQVAIATLTRKIDHETNDDTNMSSDLIHVARDELNAAETMLSMVQELEARTQV